MFLNAIYAFMATLGFGIVFNLKGKHLAFAALGGSLSWFLYILCIDFRFSIIASLFTASVLGGIYSEILARVLKAPVTVFVICAIIPLVPGSGMYYTMLESIRGNIYGALSSFLSTLSYAGAIAIGILLVSSVMKIINSIKKASV